MAAELITIAEDAKALIDAATLSLPIAEVKRCYIPRITRENNTDLRVYVMAVGVEAEQAGRRIWGYNYSLQIVVVKAVDSVEPEHVDPLVLFTQEIEDLFRNQILATSGYRTKEIETVPYDYDKLKGGNLFMSMVDVKLEGSRDV